MIRGGYCPALNSFTKLTIKIASSCVLVGDEGFEPPTFAL
jgi:hypothetical protein